MLKRSRVFISYAWEDNHYRQLVKQFAGQLRGDGINARLDAWHLMGGTIPEFMAHEVRKADKIVVLCSPQYRTKVHAMEDGRHLSGSGWEAMLINSTIWARHRNRNRIIPVLFRGDWRKAAPDFLSAVPFIDLTDAAHFEENYSVLLQKLRGQEEKPPALGMPQQQAIEPLQRGIQGVGISAQPQVTLVSNAAIPRQLPSPPSDFVGRKADISRLVDAVRQRGATISGVRGLGGIGKTALALVVANNLAVDFPVGQIYLDLKGAADWQDTSGIPPLTAQEAMDHVIRSFNPRAEIPSTDSEREGLYRTTLNGKRVLLLL
jgi:hypothetical protein